jgi:DNA invertase Pin-like site-specific DNA recombinase
MTDTPDDDADAVEANSCPMCAVPAGSACRTRAGKVAPKYHTGRIGLVPRLRAKLAVPPSRRPGRVWEPCPMRDVAPPPDIEPGHILRIGYCRTSTRFQELQSQLVALRAADCLEIYQEQVSTREEHRPRLAAAISHARTIKQAVPDQAVYLSVHELKRLGRGAVELVSTAEDLLRDGIGLEMLTGPLQGLYNPVGHGAALFAFFAAMAESERDYIRERTLEGQEASRANGTHGGRPNVINDKMAAYARDLRRQGVPVAQIRTELVIPSGKNKGEHPSLASVYRILEEEQ